MEVLPLILLRFCSAYKPYRPCTTAQMVYGTTLHLPRECFSNPDISQSLNVLITRLVFALFFRTWHRVLYDCSLLAKVSSHRIYFAARMCLFSWHCAMSTPECTWWPVEGLQTRCDTFHYQCGVALLGDLPGQDQVAHLDGLDVAASDSKLCHTIKP